MYAKIKEKKYLGKVIKNIEPCEDNPRNGTGVFYKMKDGSIAFLYERYRGESGSDFAPSQIVICYSYDDGESFTEPKKLFDCLDVNAYNVGGLNLLDMQDGSIGIFYYKRPLGTERINAICFRSTKDFTQLSEEKIIATDAYWVGNPQRVIRAKNGNIIIPLTVHEWTKKTPEELALTPPGGDPYNFGPGVFSCFISEDDGKTYKQSQQQAIILDEGLPHDGMQEAGVQELQDGRLFAYARTSLGRHYQSISYDGGWTWSEPKPSKFTGPLSPLDMIRLKNGMFVIVYNPVPWYPGSTSPSPWRGRTPFVLRVGDGNLDKISDAYILEDDPFGSYCYTTFIETDDSIIMNYMAGGEGGRKRLSNLRMRKIPKSEFLQDFIASEEDKINTF